jgi:hypothetical protein
MCTRLLIFGVFGLGFMVMPSPVLAQQTGQSAIAGVVKDATGAVLPGVTVEASSPALIEKSHTAVTNDAGQYRVVDLRPGTYKVTFTLTGFSTIVREGIVLDANFVAPVNVDMKVGGVEQSITVTGESPVVDVQTSQRREVVTQELLEVLPTGRSFILEAATVPAVTTGTLDVGGSASMWVGGSLLVHGSLSFDSRTLIDGMQVDAMFGGGQCSCVYDNELQTQEMAVQVGGGTAENQLSGVIINRIPKTGANRFSGEFVGLYANSSLQSNNLNPEIEAAGLTVPQRLYKDYDLNYSGGGPIVKDRLWFFVSGRNWAYNNYVAGAFNPDGSQAVDDNDLKAFPGRLTAQVSPKNKLTAMFDWDSKIRGHRNLSSVISPAASIQQKSPAEHILQAKWTSTLSTKLLFEAGYTQSFNNQIYSYEPQVALTSCFTAFVNCAPGTNYGTIGHQDLVLGTQYDASISGPGTTAPEVNPALSQVAVTSLSYVTGSHAFKVGFQDRWGYSRNAQVNVNGDLVQQYANGVPTQVTEYNTPVINIVNVDADLGVYLQDTWTTNRLTLSPGLRFDYFTSSIPAQSVQAGRFVPARNFAPIPNVADWKDISPRLGVSFDLSGDGKTAIKGNIGRYVQSEGPGYASTYNPMVFSSNICRWADLNHDDIAEENEITACSNNAFGLRAQDNPAPGISRPYQWVYDVGVQRELRPGVGLSVTYNRRVFHDIIWTQNLAAPYSAYTLTSVSNPYIAGQNVPVYSINPANLGQINEIDNNSPNNRLWYQGIDTSITMRWHGATLTGGTSTGRTLSVTCDVTDPNSLLYCDQTQYHVPFRTVVRISGTYLLPFGIRASAVFQSIPGATYNITYLVNRTVLKSLTQASVTENLVPPNTVFYPTDNQLDLSLSKTVRAGGVQFRPEIALFNLNNASPISAQTTSFGPNLGKVTTILPPRMARLGVTVIF